MGGCDGGDHCGAATGHVRAASIGAAAGAAAGALTGAMVQENQASRLLSAAAGWLSIRALGRDARLLLQSLPGCVYDLRGIPPGGLTRDVDTGRLFRKP
jgi:hypothetical protein